LNQVLSRPNLVGRPQAIDPKAWRANFDARAYIFGISPTLFGDAVEPVESWQTADETQTNLNVD